MTQDSHKDIEAQNGLSSHFPSEGRIRVTYIEQQTTPEFISSELPTDNKILSVQLSENEVQ